MDGNGNNIGRRGIARGARNAPEFLLMEFEGVVRLAVFDVYYHVEIWKGISRRAAGTQSKENDGKRDWNSNHRMRNL